MWRPLPGPQTKAYESLADELFFGGSAGGGKSALALGLAVCQHERSLIFRREYKDLKSIIRDSHIILDGSGARWNGSEKSWVNIPGGRLIDFGAMQYSGKRAGWQGQPHDLIVLDEGPQFNEEDFLFITGWARTTTPSQRVRVVVTGNPPTEADGEWVIRRWRAWLDKSYENPAGPGELRWYARLNNADVEVEGPEPFDYNGETIYPTSRTFIPSSLSDNPYLNNDNHYRARLQNMPEPLRSQMLYGDFSIGLRDDPWQVIPTSWAQAAMDRFVEWKEMGKPGRFEGMGLDVGRHHDLIVAALRYGNAIDDLKRYPVGTNTMAPIGFITALLDKNPTAYCCPDETGVGTGLVDRLFELGYKKRVRPFVAGAHTERRTKDDVLGFANRRSMAWWNLRELLDPEATTEPVVLPDDPNLLGDLCAIRYKIASDGKIQIEDKEKTREKLGRSPDAGDAVMQAFAPPEARGTFIV